MAYGLGPPSRPLPQCGQRLNGTKITAIWKVPQYPLWSLTDERQSSRSKGALPGGLR
jgi:hypothetical protein